MISRLIGRNKTRRSGRLERSRRLAMECLEKREVLSTVVWSPGPSLPTARTDVSAFVGPDNAVVVVGGTTTAVSKLNSTASTWTAGPDVDKALKSPGVVKASNGTVYLYGGLDGNKATEEGWTYDYYFGDNQNIGNLNTPRANFGAVIDSLDRAYAIGGLDDENNVLASVERYDAIADEWVEIDPLPAPKQNAAVAIDDSDHIFVFGGQSSTGIGSIVNTSFRYDVINGAWEPVAPMPIGTIDSAAVFAQNGRIYVLGGRTSAGTIATVQVYNPATDSWTIDTDLPIAVHSAAAAVDSLSRIVIAGGTDAAGNAVSSVFRSQRFDVPESAPLITSNPVTSGTLDGPYSYDVNATGNPEPTYSLVTAPAGMTIHAHSGLISWQPVEGQAGTHSVTVRAENRMGYYDQTFVVNVLADTTPPTAPTNLTVVSTDTTSVTLSWNPSTDNRSDFYYEVLEAYRTGWRGSKTAYRVVQTGITSTTTTITGLAPLSSHKYVVRAVDVLGNKSTNSNQVIANILSAPTLRYYVNGSINGVVNSKANHLLRIQLAASANPAPTFSLVAGPSTMTVDPVTGLLDWTPTAADVGSQTATVAATNSVGTAQIDIPILVTPDVPVLYVQFNPTTGGARYALAGIPLELQVIDTSHTPSTFELVAAPAGMTIDANTGLIQWTPSASDAGPTSVTVRATNSAGSTDLTVSFETFFTASPTNIQVTNLTALHPTVTWTAPTGEGASDIAGYTIQVTSRYRYGRTYRTERLVFDSPGTDTSEVLTGLTTGRKYKVVINAYRADGARGVLSTELVEFTPRPALPVVSWTVTNPNGGAIVAGQPVQIQLTNSNPDPVSYAIVSAPSGMTIDASTGLASWVPSASDVGYHTATFRVTNGVGPVDIAVPINVLFSGPVGNVVAIRNGNNATVSWTAPTNNVAPIAAYQITMHWVWNGRQRSRTIMVAGTNLSVDLTLVPTGAVWHQGVTVTPVDELGRLGAASPLTYYAG